MMNYKKLLIISVSLIASYNAMAVTSSNEPTVIPATGTIEIAFSPNNGVTQSVVNAINTAKQQILVEAYSFTSKDIAGSLLSAKKRGLDIQIILDKSQVGRKYSAATFFSNLGFNVHIDTKHAIFHDKVMIIDSNKVITGSFNFTKAAETKNAENLLILRNNPKLASIYTREFVYNWQQSLPYNDYVNNKLYLIKNTKFNKFNKFNDNE